MTLTQQSPDAEFHFLAKNKTECEKVVFAILRLDKKSDKLNPLLHLEEAMNALEYIESGSGDVALKSLIRELRKAYLRVPLEYRFQKRRAQFKQRLHRALNTKTHQAICSNAAEIKSAMRKLFAYADDATGA